MLFGAMGSSEGWTDSGSVPDINAGFVDGMIEREVDRVNGEIEKVIDLVGGFLK